MSNNRKQYAREFKVMAVELSKSRSDLSVLAKELEIKSSLLYRWRRELETKAATSFPGQGKLIFTPEQAEIHWLKKELLDMQQERGILKGCRHLLQERWQIFGFIKDNRTGFTIGKMCKIFKVSRSGFYVWLKGDLSFRGKENQ